jgi:hypothetical protein
MRRRLIITFGRESSESVIRFRIQLRVLIVLVTLLVGSSVLFVVGATWGAKTLISDLLRQNASLVM